MNLLILNALNLKLSFMENFFLLGLSLKTNPIDSLNCHSKKSKKKLLKYL